jgi:hypothetical protein
MDSILLNINEGNTYEFSFNFNKNPLEFDAITKFMNSLKYNPFKGNIIALHISQASANMIDHHAKEIIDTF